MQLMLIDAFKYKQWSDQRLADAAMKIDKASFPHAIAFIRQQLNHMVRVEELFQARLTGGPVPHLSTNTEMVPEFDALMQRVHASNHWYMRYAESLEDCRYQEPVSFEFVDGRNGKMTRQEILFHVINHGTYHRGAMGHCLDLAGVPHPADTFTVFIHTAEPMRRESGVLN